MPNATDPRRGNEPQEGAFLKLVGSRVRLQRTRRGMSRKVLSKSGVSERYLAELERGRGNASMLVLKQIAEALDLKIHDLICEDEDLPIDLILANDVLRQLSPTDLASARRMLADQFAISRPAVAGRISLIGMRGAGKSTIGRLLADQLETQFVELNREIELVTGMRIPQIVSVEGNDTYRKIERECLEEVIKSTPRVVIEAASGLVSNPASFELLRQSSFVIWLHATPEQHLARAQKSGMLSARRTSRHALSEFKSVLESLRPQFATAHAGIDTSDKTPEECVRELIGILHDVGEEHTNSPRQAARA